MENILMMFLGMVIWQAIIFLLTLLGNPDSDIQQMCYCGIWSLLFFIIVKPIIHLVYKIRIAIFNKKYVRLSFWRAYTGGLDYCTTFWAKQDVVEKLYITDNPQEENRNSVQIINIKIEKNLPYRDEILTPDKLENGCKGWTADFFHKFMK